MISSNPPINIFHSLNPQLSDIVEESDGSLTIGGDSLKLLKLMVYSKGYKRASRKQLGLAFRELVLGAIEK